MRKADFPRTTVLLSELTADPILKAFFNRGLGSEGFTVPARAPWRPVRPLDGLVRAEIPVPAYA